MKKNIIYLIVITAILSLMFSCMPDEPNWLRTNPYDVEGQETNTEPVNFTLAGNVVYIAPTEVSIFWDRYSLDNFYAYHIYTNNGLYKSINEPTITSAVIKGLSPDTDYAIEFEVETKSSVTVSATINLHTRPAGARPLAVAGVSTNVSSISMSAVSNIRDIQASSVTVEWTRNVEDDFFAYKIYGGKVSNLTETDLRTTITDSGITEFTATNLDPFTYYYFKIVVENIGGFKSESAVVSFRTQPETGYPMTIKDPVAAAGESQIYCINIEYISNEFSRANYGIALAPFLLIGYKGSPLLFGATGIGQKQNMVRMTSMLGWGFIDEGDNIVLQYAATNTNFVFDYDGPINTNRLRLWDDLGMSNKFIWITNFYFVTNEELNPDTGVVEWRKIEIWTNFRERKYFWVDEDAKNYADNVGLIVTGLTFDIYGYLTGNSGGNDYTNDARPIDVSGDFKFFKVKDPTDTFVETNSWGMELWEFRYEKSTYWKEPLTGEWEDPISWRFDYDYTGGALENALGNVFVFKGFLYFADSFWGDLYAMRRPVSDIAAKNLEADEDWETWYDNTPTEAPYMRYGVLNDYGDGYYEYDDGLIWADVKAYDDVYYMQAYQKFTITNVERLYGATADGTIHELIVSNRFVTNYGIAEIEISVHPKPPIYNSAWNTNASASYSYAYEDLVSFAVDAHQVYALEKTANRMVIFNMDRTNSQIIGGNGSRYGEFNAPSSVVLFRDNVFVADTLNHRVQIFKRTGEFVSSIGSYGLGNNQFDTPTFVSIASNQPLVGGGWDFFLLVSDKSKIRYFNVGGLFN